MKYMENWNLDYSITVWEEIEHYTRYNVWPDETPEWIAECDKRIKAKGDMNKIISYAKDNIIASCIDSINGMSDHISECHHMLGWHDNEENEDDDSPVPNEKLKDTKDVN